MFIDKSLLAIASLALVNGLPISERATCSSYTLISTRGTTELQGPSAGFRGMISQTLAAIPGGKEYDTIYPAAFDQNSASGTADGAAASVDAMRQLSRAAMDSVKGVILIGDPEHKPGLACNVDAQGGSSTKNAIGIESFRGGIPEAWIPKTLDICALGDGVCSGGGITFQHLTYGFDASVQSMGVKFMQKALGQG